ncbi:FAD/NAD(P)-binding domain-containing protein [Tothia fuscella]|uniref:FAD/NAD(P)-binding domain-containing protein n=1 Tax=Tothia fuscella TaxID=1048955 RepID=A0A9P4TV49_9PEZI|nr:FAD/NAD(P)-binding domain-containing protein [Tothia fuscella]
MTISIPAKSLKVAIIGAGPGGLATAIALSKVPNTEVTLYEKAKVLREVGAGINVNANTWNVLRLLGVAESLTSGHRVLTILNVSMYDQKNPADKTAICFACPSSPWYSPSIQGLERTEDLGGEGVRLYFLDDVDNSLKKVVRDSAWPTYDLQFTGTTIWRALVPRAQLRNLDPRFDTTAWWHLPTSHVYFSPVSEDLSEIASREVQDPRIHGANKLSWGVPVTNEEVESHFTVSSRTDSGHLHPLTDEQNYLPQIQAALKKVEAGAWREFAAFAGPELSQLRAWDNKVALVGDASHALSGAFGSGAAFAMEDGLILAQALAYFKNDLSKALPLFDSIRLPYYTRMYAVLEMGAKSRKERLEHLSNPTEEDMIRAKVIKSGGGAMDWIYENKIDEVWEDAIKEYERKESNKVERREEDRLWQTIQAFRVFETSNICPTTRHGDKTWSCKR